MELERGMSKGEADWGNHHRGDNRRKSRQGEDVCGRSHGESKGRRS